MSGRGLLGDAPSQVPSFRMNQQINNKIPDYLYSHQPPPPPSRTPPLQQPPRNPIGTPGMGLLGDAPPGLPPRPFPNNSVNAVPGHGTGSSPGTVTSNNQTGQSLLLPPSAGLIRGPIQKQNKNVLTQQIKKLKDLKGRVIILNFQKMAADESIVKMGNLFGSLKNYLNTSKGTQGKAWLEFYHHLDAVKALECIGNGDVLHLNDPIDVGASTWKEIIRKDGKDLWKLENERKRRHFDESCLDQGSTDSPPAKIRRDSENSDKSEPTTTALPKVVSKTNLHEIISDALALARKIECGEISICPTEATKLKLSLTDSIELVSILGKISRDQDLINAKRTLCTGLDL